MGTLQGELMSSHLGNHKQLEPLSFDESNAQMAERLKGLFGAQVIVGGMPPVKAPGASIGLPRVEEVSFEQEADLIARLPLPTWVASPEEREPKARDHSLVTLAETPIRSPQRAVVEEEPQDFGEELEDWFDAENPSVPRATGLSILSRVAPLRTPILAGLVLGSILAMVAVRFWPFA